MAACTWPSNSNLSQTLKKAKYLKVTQLLSRQSVPTTFYGCIVSKLPTQAWNKAKISRTTYPSENGSFQARKSLYNWRILIGRIAWRTPPDTALDILTELFPWRSASELMYFARLRHGIFPCLSENSKVGLISGDVLSSARSSRLCKRIAKILRLFYIWMKQIMSEPRTKFDCIENVKRKVASNPKLSFIVFSFLLTAFLVQLTLGIILVIKLGQESSETKGRYGFH